jgi:hypothetical protein
MSPAESELKLKIFPKAVRIIKWTHFALLIALYFTHHVPTFSRTLNLMLNSKTSTMQDYRAKHSNLEIFTRFIATQSESEM